MSTVLRFPGEKTKRAERHEELRQKFFGDVESKLWNRKKEKGFCTIPRTLGLIMTLLNLLSKNKDLSRVYFELWCRAFDEAIVDVTDEDALAYASGYVSPTRNIRTWRERVMMLEKLWFIATKQVGSRKYRYILLLHPHQVIEKLHEDGQVGEDWYSAYLSRAAEIGTKIPQSEVEEKRAASRRS